MARRLIVDNLVDEVRSMLDEENRENISDTTDILPALNRAQDYGANILARHYEAPLLTYNTITTTAGVNEYYIPEDAFEQRLEKLEVEISPGHWQEIHAISFRDATAYEYPNSSSYPSHYAIIGGKYRLYPTVGGTRTIRQWFDKDPEPLVLSQGRITSVNTASNYFILNSQGTSLTTEIDDLNCFINIIDGQSGRIKGSFQIQSLNSGQVTIKTTPDRSTVLNKTIATSLADLEIEADDLVSTIHGSCVPVIKKPLSNFLIEYATSEIKRKLDNQTGADPRILDNLERQVERSWVGRPLTTRIKRVNPIWARRRWRGR